MPKSTTKYKGKVLQVTQLGASILRKKSNKVKNIKLKKIQELIDDMIATVKEVDGVGIASPQVNQPLRLFIMASHPNIRYPKAPKMKPTAVINPRIINRSKLKIKDWEGCLSIPGIRGLVPRSETIDVQYQDREGKTVKKKYHDFVARIFQHEYDHLEGIMFIDRMHSMKDLISEKEYQKMMKKEKKD